MPKLLISAGVVLIVVGLLWRAGLPIGRLPGDLRFQVGPGTVYVPLATSILLSIVLTLLGAFLRR